MAAAFRSSASNSGGSGTLTITKPAGLAVGDLLVLDALQDTGACALTGWTAVGTTANTPTNAFPCNALYKVANAGDVAATNFTFTGTGSNCQGTLYAYSGVDTVTPFDVAQTQSTGTAATVTYPSIGPSVTTGALPVHLVNNFNATPSTPTGYSTGSNQTWAAQFYKNATVGSGTTVSGDTSTGGGEWVARSLLLRPAGGAATHTSTGVLTGQGSTIAGTSVHKTKHVTSGALTGQGSTVAGTAKRFRAHPTSGALTGPGSTVAGTAAHLTRHTTSGALTGPGSTLAGTATHSAAGHTTHDTSGVLVGPGAFISGVATHIPARRSEGSFRRKPFRYDRWGKKKKQALKKSPEAVQIVEQVAEETADEPDYSWLATAVQRLERELAAEHIKASHVYVELLQLERDRLASEDEDDDDLLLL